MNNFSIPTSLAMPNVVTPFNPVGRQAVSLESPDTKKDLFTAVEQGEDTQAPVNREDATQKPVQSASEERRQQQMLQEEQRIIRELASRDREVRAHEAAHAAVGGKYAGAPTFSFQRGPDGVLYAVGGEVSISLPQGGDPQARLTAAEQVRRAALAPAEPSAQDRRVAASATQAAAAARAEIAAERAEEAAESTESESNESEAVNESRGIEEPQSTDAEDSEREDQEEREPLFQSDAGRRITDINNSLVGLEDDILIGNILDRRA